MKRRRFIGWLAAVAVAPQAIAQDARRATLYKNPQCGCCEDYAKYLRGHGFEVEVVPTHEPDAIKTTHGVPESLNGCHTTLLGGYVIEGHVPVGTIQRLLRERPRIGGISLPGMPQGSQGRTGRKKEPFTIYEIGPQAAAKPKVYVVE